MRAALVCFLLLICVLANEARPVPHDKDNKGSKPLEDFLEDLRKSDSGMLFQGGHNNEKVKKILKELTEAESDPQSSGGGEINPVDY